MVALTVRRIFFGGAGIFLFVQAARAFRLGGWTGDTILAAVMGVLFAMMALTGKSG
jgi:hypothetical protein